MVMLSKTDLCPLKSIQQTVTFRRLKLKKRGITTNKEQERPSKEDSLSYQELFVIL